MKKYLFLFLFITTGIFIVKGQGSKESVKVGCMYSFDNQLNLSFLFIDTVSNPANVWQIGQPQKNVFDSAYSLPNVIVTKTDSCYPVNDTSSFIIKAPLMKKKSSKILLFNLSGYYYVNSDTLTDFGYIELSFDNGATWIDLLNDTILIDTAHNIYWYWMPNPKPVFSGNSGGWKYFIVYMDMLYDLYGSCNYNYALIKFTFVSDSIQTNKDGLMFDNLYIDFYCEGIENQGSGIKSSECFPNPANNHLNITFTNDANDLFELRIYDMTGKELLCKETKSVKFKIDISGYNQGVYFYKLRNKNNDKYAMGRFVKH